MPFLQHNPLNYDKNILLWNSFCTFIILLMLIIQKKYTHPEIAFYHEELLYYRMVIYFRGTLSHFLFLEIQNWRKPLPGRHSFSLFTFSDFSCMRHLPSNFTQLLYSQNIFISSYRREKLIHFITKAYTF